MTSDKLMASCTFRESEAGALRSVNRSSLCGKKACASGDRWAAVAAASSWLTSDLTRSCCELESAPYAATLASAGLTSGDEDEDVGSDPGSEADGMAERGFDRALSISRAEMDCCCLETVGLVCGDGSGPNSCATFARHGTESIPSITITL